jgi:hypothetical protein
MTESQVVNGWIREGEIKGVLGERRRNLLETLDDRFPGRMTDDVRRMIQQQESLDLLGDWNRAARRVSSYDDFLGILRG